MRIDKDDFVTITRAFIDTGVVNVGPCSNYTLVWALENHLPYELIDLLKTHSPKTEVWAGAGALFDEARIVQWNNDYPEALANGLLIVGSAPNGDHISIDLRTGDVGYISHEHSWQSTPREFFIAISPSIGAFIRDINIHPTTLPEDYWEAKEASFNNLTR